MLGPQGAGTGPPPRHGQNDAYLDDDISTRQCDASFMTPTRSPTETRADEGAREASKKMSYLRCHAIDEEADDEVNETSGGE